MYELDDEEPLTPVQRPTPRRVRDPQQSPWLPADLEEELHRKPKVSSKQQVSHLLRIFAPVLATLVSVAALGYVLYVLIGVYTS